MKFEIDYNTNQVRVDGAFGSVATFPLNVVGAPGGGGSAPIILEDIVPRTALSTPAAGRLLRIEGVWVKPSNALSFLRLKLNGVAPVMPETVEFVQWEGGQNDPSFPEFALGVHSVASEHQINATLQFSEDSARNTLLETRGTVWRPGGSGTLDTFHTVMVARCVGAGAPLSSLAIETSVVDDIGVGSWFIISEVA